MKGTEVEKLDAAIGDGGDKNIEADTAMRGGGDTRTDKEKDTVMRELIFEKLQVPTNLRLGASVRNMVNDALKDPTIIS